MTEERLTSSQIHRFSIPDLNFSLHHPDRLATRSPVSAAWFNAVIGLLQERERTGHGLRCVVRLLLLLLRLNVNDDKYAMLEAAIGFEPQLRNEFVSIATRNDRSKWLKYSHPTKSSGFDFLIKIYLINIYSAS